MAAQVLNLNPEGPLHPKVQALLTRPQYAQRSPEWYEVRKTLLTAR